MDTGSILLHVYNVTDTENSNAHLPLAPDNPYILDKNSKSPHMNIMIVYCLQLCNDLLLTSIIKQILTSISFH